MEEHRHRHRATRAAPLSLSHSSSPVPLRPADRLLLDVYHAALLKGRAEHAQRAYALLLRSGRVDWATDWRAALSHIQGEGEQRTRWLRETLSVHSRRRYSSHSQTQTQESRREVSARLIAQRAELTHSAHCFYSILFSFNQYTTTLSTAILLLQCLTCPRMDGWMANSAQSPVSNRLNTFISSLYVPYTLLHVRWLARPLAPLLSSLIAERGPARPRPPPHHRQGSVQSCTERD